jgi:esterase/lipase
MLNHDAARKEADEQERAERVQADKYEADTNAAVERVERLLAAVDRSIDAITRPVIPAAQMRDEVNQADEKEKR